jgi:hypothetical protein
MNSRFRRLAMVSLVALIAACASAGAGTETSSGTVSPKLTSIPSTPRLDPSAGEAPSSAVDLQVWVDTFGKADLRTLTFTGGTNDRFEAAVKQWLSTATFQPATENGQPTRGLWKLHYNRPTVTRRTR